MENSTRIACSACLELRPREAFSKRQWKKARHSRKCSDCAQKAMELRWKTVRMENSTRSAREKKCGACLELRPREAFSKTQWRNAQPNRTCTDCIPDYIQKLCCRYIQKLCCRCKRSLRRTEFPQFAWRYKDDLSRTCLACSTQCKDSSLCGDCKENFTRNEMTESERGGVVVLVCTTCHLVGHRKSACSQCGLQKPRYEFAICLDRTPSYMLKSQKRRCDVCLRGAEQQRMGCGQTGLSHVSKRRRV